MMRERQGILLKDNLEGTLVPLVFNSAGANGRDGMETKDVPCVIVKNLSSMVLDYLDRHEWLVCLLELSIYQKYINNLIN